MEKHKRSTAMGSTTGDQFANFGKALSTTASVLFSTQGMEDTILSYSSPYKRLLHQTITSAAGSSSLVKLQKDQNLRKGKNEGFQNIFSGSREFFQNSYSDSKTTFKVLSYLSDDLLNDVPTDTKANNKKLLTQSGDKKKRKPKKQEPTLYQGFEASLPVINETIEIQQKMILNSDIKPITESASKANEDDEDIDDEFSLPNHMKAEDFNSSYSTAFLKEASFTINN